ncbi:NADH dehydrogenase subunit 3 [Physocladia obscura]|uniref:NADH-ubiquinone oxidoreductase chain 3 n=1 Tax=Physocladia obscura TaxID=109957 RepID=A0AAD5SYM8_9FUNG|nr:NADH dehydrogenase subunit 3 [Physocladia obscura]
MTALTVLFISETSMMFAILLMANVLLAVHKPDSEKVTPYECGFSPVYGQTRAPFSIQYYLVGILFLIFDLEILLFYPLAVTLYSVSTYGFVIGMFFGKGALYFTDQRSAIRAPETPTGQ